MIKLRPKDLSTFRENMAKEQGGLCAICYTPLKGTTKCLDHDHKTGVIRAVLCNNCNGIEGRLKNLATKGKRKFTEKWFIQRVLDYWQTHSVDRTGVFHPTHKTQDEKRLQRNLKARQKRTLLTK